MSKLAVIKQNMVANLNILGKVYVRNVDNIVCGNHFGTAENFNHLASLIFYRSLDVGCAHLRTFSVNHKGYVWRYSTYVTHNCAYSVWCGMCCIHTHYVHACKEELADKIDITTAVTNRCNNLCLFHCKKIYIMCFF